MLALPTPGRSLTYCLTALVIVMLIGAPYGHLQASPGLPAIMVEADHFEVDFNSERATWRGNVTATQGNYTFRTSSLTVQLEQLQSETGNGNPGGANTSVPAGYELSADAVTYDLDQGRIVGRGNSELRRGVEMIRAERIVYQIEHRRASATPKANGRVLVQFISNPQQPIFPTVNLMSAVAGD
jgi:lipopolysaccharide transport protein LptA